MSTLSNARLRRAEASEPVYTAHTHEPVPVPRTKSLICRDCGMLLGPMPRVEPEED